MMDVEKAEEYVLISVGPKHANIQCMPISRNIIFHFPQRIPFASSIKHRASSIKHQSTKSHGLA